MTLPSWAVGAILALIGLAFTGLGFFYSRVKSAEAKAREDGVVSTKLDNLDKKFDTMAASYIRQQDVCIMRGERLALVEASAKSAHLRIDEIAKKKGDS